MSAPKDVLLVRAVSHLERAQLELASAGDSWNDGDVLGGDAHLDVAGIFLDRGLKLVREVLES